MKLAPRVPVASLPLRRAAGGGRGAPEHGALTGHGDLGPALDGPALLVELAVDERGRCANFGIPFGQRSRRGIDWGSPDFVDPPTSAARLPAIRPHHPGASFSLLGHGHASSLPDTSAGSGSPRNTMH